MGIWAWRNWGEGCSKFELYLNEFLPWVLLPVNSLQTTLLTWHHVFLQYSQSFTPWFEGMVRQEWYQHFGALEILPILMFALHRNITQQSHQRFYSLSPSAFFSPSFHSLHLCLSFSLSFSVRLFWKRCQHCCFYTKRLLLSDGWRQPQLQRRACVCLAAEGRSHWKGQNWEALLVTAMKTLTSTNRIAISNNCAQFIRSDLW